LSPVPLFLKKTFLTAKIVHCDSETTYHIVNEKSRVFFGFGRTPVVALLDLESNAQEETDCSQHSCDKEAVRIAEPEKHARGGG